MDIIENPSRWFQGFVAGIGTAAVLVCIVVPFLTGFVKGILKRIRQ